VSGVPKSLTPVELEQIDEICDEFEDAWRRGEQPRVEAVVERVPATLRPHLLDALLPLIRELLVEPTPRSPAPRGPVLTKSDPAIHRTLEPSEALDVDRPTGAVDAEGECGLRLEIIEGQSFEFRDHATLVAGRSSLAQLQLGKDPHFSRHHFRLEINPPKCYLLDLDSRNGTWINGTRKKDGFLNDGDIISGGKTRLRVHIRGPRSERQRTKTPPTQTALALLGQTDSAVVPGYQLLDVRGRGDLGVTYHARHVQTQRECAIKLLQPSEDVSHKALARFSREAKLLQQLKHPKIIEFVDCGRQDNLLYLVYEFVSDMGGPSVLARAPLPFRTRLACHWMRQVLAALDYAHSRGYVHRDVKPANVLITKPKEQWIAKLADFGVAKSYVDVGLSNITRDGDVCGSLPYMPPEQFVDSRNAQPSVDVYAAGATLYFWLTGETPHDFSQRKCQFLAILEDEPIPLLERQPQIPSALAELVHKALARDPRDRFASASTMSAALRPFVAG
jgi:pSer/pThr/pTyr-binding forkhead associated (FHA) protein